MKTLIALSFLIIFSCSGIKKEKNDSTSINNNMNKISLVKEMESTKEIETFKFKKISNENIIVFFKELKKYENEIRKVDLKKLSKWAKENMTTYQLPDNFFDETKATDIYQTKEKTVIVYKSILLPTHSSLVKRFLYFITVYNSENKIEKIYVTIQGYAEE